MTNDATTRVLLIDDDVDDYILTRELFSLIKGGTYALDWVSTYEEGLTAAGQGLHQVCLVDYRLGARTGVELIRDAREARITTPMILLTGQADYETDLEAMEAGATDFLIKAETSPARLERTIRYAVRLNSERTRTEAMLAAYGQRQAAVAELGRMVLSGGSLKEFFVEAVQLLRHTLDVDHCKILELRPDGSTLVLRAGAGWNAEYPVDVTTVAADKHSQSGLTLLSNEPIVVEDLREEIRFSGSPFLLDHGIVSGVTVVIRGRGESYGVLGIHTTHRRQFTHDEVNFLQVVANAIGDMIDRKNAEAELSQSNARRNLILGSDLLGILSFDFSGSITEANGAFLKMVGYTREELAAGQLRWPELTPAEYRLMDQNALAELSASGVSQTYEKEYIRKDGSRIPILIGCTSFAGDTRGGVAFVLDITERNRALKSLRQSEAQFRSLFEKSLDGVMITDDQGVCTDANPAVTELLGITYNQVVGRSILDMTETLFRDETAGMWTQFLREGTMRGLFQLKRADGETVQVEFSAISDFLPGRHLLMLRDVTEQRLLEHQVRQSAKLESVGLLAGGIAHDFNNLLTVITGYSELALKNQAEGDSFESHISEILKAAGRAAELTRQLLAFSRKQILQPRVISLNPLIVNIERMLSLIVGENIEVVLLKGDELGFVKADPGQIEQVIMNLVVNARDAMPNGGRVVLATANISVAADHRDHLDIEPGRYVVLSVTDTGSGMEADTQSHIFEPFFTTKEFGKGTGLGLSTVYGIVKQSGGHIEVLSEIEGGTTFQIYLPRVTAAVVDADIPFDVVVPDKAAVAHTILLVEDDDMVRSLARACLESNGYVVLDAPGGKEAIKICREHLAPIHLMLTDVVMPQMSGGQLAEHVAEIRPDTRILFMSGYTDKTIVERGILKTSVDFIAKPFTPDKLTLKVAEVLQRERRPSPG